MRSLLDFGVLIALCFISLLIWTAKGRINSIVRLKRFPSFFTSFPLSSLLSLSHFFRSFLISFSRFFPSNTSFPLSLLPLSHSFFFVSLLSLSLSLLSLFPYFSHTLISLSHLFLSHTLSCRSFSLLPIISLTHKHCLLCLYIFFFYFLTS